MKEKRKKIVVRVGAMVAAVLLVVLCALPVFADDEVSMMKWTHWDVAKEIIDEYSLTPYKDAAWWLLYYNWSSIEFNPDVHKDLIQFRPLGVGYSVSSTTLQNLKVYEFPEYGCGVVTSGDMNFTFYENCYLTSTYTTSGDYRFVYLDMYAKPRDGYAVDTTRVLRIRYKTLVADGSIINVEVTGDYDGNVEDLQIAFIGGDANSKTFDYALSRGLIEVDDNLRVRWWNFVRGLIRGEAMGYDGGFETGKDLGYNQGYDDGMSQSSLIDGVTAIFRAPMELINSVLNFEILGINMAVAVRVLISMAILGMVITIIWKAVK